MTQRLQPFLDDLLQEDDYQDIRRHVTSCARCQDHLHAVDSLSSAVKTLGESQVPQDLVDTVLFRLRQPMPAGQPRGVAPTRSIPVPAFAVVVAAVMAFGGVWAWHLRGRTRPPADDSVVVTAVMSDSDHHEVDQALQELKAVTPALGAVDDANGQASPEAEGRTASAAATAITPSTTLPAPSEMKPLHWHVPCPSLSERQRLLNALRILGISPEYELPELLVVSAFGWQLERLAEEIKTMSPTPDTLGLGPLPARESQTRLSLYLADGAVDGNGPLHWDLPLAPSHHADVLRALGGLGIAVAHQSTGLVVLSVPSLELATLIERIKQVVGEAGTAGAPNIGHNRRNSGAVRVSLYLAEP